MNRIETKLARTAKTAHGERDAIAADFKAGRLANILNVNVFTEGFNAKGIDAIVLLRPTLSKGLYSPNQKLTLDAPSASVRSEETP